MSSIRKEMQNAALQREYHVTLTGPTTFTALMNAQQMGFRSLAIEKRSSEVWQILGAVRSESGKHNEVVDKHPTAWIGDVLLGAAPASAISCRLNSYAAGVIQARSFRLRIFPG